MKQNSEPFASGERARLKKRVQIGYAAADIGVNAVELAIRLYLLIFYTDKVGLSPSLAGVALGIGLMWDAVTDPVMGAITDSLAPRRGRRMFLWSGGLMSAFGFWLLFSPPALDGEMDKFLWLTFTFCFLNTGLTVINIPHVSMSTEMTGKPPWKIQESMIRRTGSPVAASMASQRSVVSVVP